MINIISKPPGASIAHTFTFIFMQADGLCILTLWKYYFFNLTTKLVV